MYKTFVLFFSLLLWPFGILALENITIDGTRYQISIPNPLSLTASQSTEQWVNSDNQSKLTYTEHNKPPEQVRRGIVNAINDSLNEFPINEFSTLRSDSDTLLVKSLVAGTEFLRILRFIGDETSSAVIEFTAPLPMEPDRQHKIVNMLTHVEWQTSLLLTVSDNPLVQITQPVGFAVTNKYTNSLVLRSSEDNSLLPEANLVLTVIPNNEEEPNLVEKTNKIFEQSKSLEKFKINNMSETTHSNWGEMVVARVSARYDSTQIEVDVSHVTLKLNESLLIVQLITVRHTESFLKLEDIMMQILSNLILKK